ncbi:MAG: ATP-binding domain-containing protein [Ilumatobacteraceae bacterium]
MNPKMTQLHPDLDAEQAYIDHAYACLERSKTDAWRIRDLNEASTGGTFQARFERNAFDEQLLNRLTQLDLGDAALVFGRIDKLAETPDGIESFHIGRLAVADTNREPVVVDWRAPIAEPFYRATGREQMGLARRRHFSVSGQTLHGIEDELFGAGHLGVGHDEGLGGSEMTPVQQTATGLRGYSTLLSVLSRGRTGQLGDIVATIQSEQDQIIRSPQHGVMVVQGGPGTGKTVVALHRAAYLLYTYRFPLEEQGVLVIGPNRVFLRYIERVLPSLGEAGVSQVVLADLVPGHRFGRREETAVERVKGDIRMVDVVAKAISDRERALRDDLVIPFGAGYLRLSAKESGRIVREARRRYRRHNAAQRWVESEMVAAMAATRRDPETDLGQLRDSLREVEDFRIALTRIWPVLTPAELLHDLFSSRALIRIAATGVLEIEEYELLYRPRGENLADVHWGDGDIAILDAALGLLGPRPRRNGKISESDEIRLYGHIIIDEVQDLTPMQLRMATRRSLNGAMTVVGDLAQATGVFAPQSWSEIVKFLPDKREPQVFSLSVGYRIPEEIMALADRVMRAAAPTLHPPRSVRQGEFPPLIVRAASDDDLLNAVVISTRQILEAIGDGNVAVVCPDSMADAVSGALSIAQVSHGRANNTALDSRLTVVPVSLVKGLELDGVVVVEPSAIVDAQENGLRALYVALTRATQRLTVVHSQTLPQAMTH